MEKLMYESRPYLYGALAFYAIVLSHNSLLMVASGLALASCCYLVSIRRYQHRTQAAIIERKLQNYLKKNV
jgi:hypothetical protein